MKRRRLFAALLAIVCWFGLVLQFFLFLESSTLHDLTTIGRIVRFLSYFTILTNLIVAVVTTAPGFFPDSRLARFASKPTTFAAVAVYILIVGVVYSLFLRDVWSPEGWQAVADHILHDIVPVAFVLFWLIFAPKNDIGWLDPLKWLIYPLIYMAYSLVGGAFVGWYPYWFVDVTLVGYAEALTNAGLVLTGFAVFGYCFVLISKLVGRKKSVFT